MGGVWSMKRKSLLLGGLLLLGMGFAVVSTTLYLNGNVKIVTNNEDFNVVFTKAVIDGTNIPSAIIEGGKKITFSTKDLITVGNISKLDFVVTNNSTMYDANVSIDCTAEGDKSSYYEITKEVASPILGKATGKGKIEVKLLKASVEDFSETFTCTLTAKAAERGEKAKYVPKYFAFGTPTTSSTQDYTTLTYPDDSPAKVFIGLDENGQKSVCIIRNDSLECFKNSNVKEEQKHVRKVFGDITCTSDSSSVNCDASDFHCFVNSNGFVRCDDRAASLYCDVYSDGAVLCT